MEGIKSSPGRDGKSSGGCLAVRAQVVLTVIKRTLGTPWQRVTFDFLSFPLILSWRCPNKISFPFILSLLREMLISFPYYINFQ